MIDGAAAKSLPELGKRIERLFYFGSLLLLLCCLDLYFVSVADYVEKENPEGIEVLISLISKDSEQLTRLFRNPPKPRQTNDDETARVNELRNKLGMPPQKETKDADPKAEENYSAFLARLTEEASKGARLSYETREVAQNASKSPQQIIVELEERKQTLAKRSVKIWGVESPLTLPLQYGGARYQVPASFIAKCLLFALVPLFIGWLASLYLTRQRELLIVRRLKYFGHAFPHVLNIFSVDLRFSEDIEASLNLRNKRKNVVEVWLGKFLPCLIRSAVVLIFSAPMAMVLGYNALQLFATGEDYSLANAVIFGTVFMWVFIQIFLLVVQEWVMLWGRTYYA